MFFCYETSEIHQWVICYELKQQRLKEVIFSIQCQLNGGDQCSI